MRQEEIMKYDGRIISKDLLDVIEASDCVKEIDVIAESKVYPTNMWYEVTFQDGTYVDIYVDIYRR